MARDFQQHRPEVRPIIDCRPPDHDPRDEPPVGDLDLPVDWMGFAHRELFEMVNQGVNLEAAEGVAQKWRHLGRELDEIAGDLRRAVQRSEGGWRGEAAELARDMGRSFVHWSDGTAGRAQGVSELVTEQADLVRTARDKMPPPLMPMFPGPPTPKPQPTGGTTPMSASPFADGAQLLGDQGAQRQMANEKHREAAEVMRQLQHDSKRIYGKVPEFPPPKQKSILVDPPKPPEPPEPPRPPKPDPEQPDDSTDPSTVGGGPAPGVPVAGGGVPGGAAPVSGGPVSGGPVSAGEQYGQGVRAGSGVPGPPPAGGAAAGAPAAAGGRGAMGPMGMPMGAAGARQGGGEETEHQRASYLEEDSDFWDAQEPVTPPVIGAEPPRRQR